MEYTAQAQWQPLLLDPTGRRSGKPRMTGRTMVIDKGIGMGAFADMLDTCAPYIDMIKIGFGTAPLYPVSLLRQKIDMAKSRDIIIYPGGTFLEVAVQQGKTDEFFEMAAELGFNGIEVSDGTIDVPRDLRNELIQRGRALGMTVVTEYGKKAWGSEIEIGRFAATFCQDLEFGAELVIVEGRENGKGVGLFDERGELRDETLLEMPARTGNADRLMWEAPLKHQQVHLMKTIGRHVNLGNIPMEDILSLECLRRGLRSDTFVLK